MQRLRDATQVTAQRSAVAAVAGRQHYQSQLACKRGQQLAQQPGVYHFRAVSFEAVPRKPKSAVALHAVTQNVQQRHRIRGLPRCQLLRQSLAGDLRQDLQHLVNRQRS